MMISDQELKQLLDNIIDIGNLLRDYHGVGYDRAVANTGAVTTKLAKLQADLGVALPPEYLRALAIYDGIANFDWVDVALFSADFLTSHPNLDEDWVDSGQYRAGQLFVIGRSNTDPLTVAFDRTVVDVNGDMQVYRFDSGGMLSEHVNFETYLRERLDWFRQSVATAEADRRSLPDDD
jgi:hypothetical protein